MKDFYSEFVKYSLQTCSKEDYNSGSKVRKHNRAMTRMLNMSSEMINADKEYASSVLFELMDHENEKVRLGSASICFINNINKDYAKQVLKRIEAESKDSILAFDASMVLKCYK